MKKLMFTLCIALFSLIAKAQDEVAQLSYGDVIQETMQKTMTEVEFSFEGVAGDIVTVEVSVDNAFLNGLSPELEILNARGSGLFKSSTIDDGMENQDLSEARIVFEIPADGQYTIRTFA